MERIEMVEKLREKASVSYEEAKAALETCDWDMLDAMVLLEQQGKIDEQEPPVASYTTHRQTPPDEEQYTERDSRKKKAGDCFERIFNWIAKIVHKGNTNSLIVLQNSQEKMSIPVTVFVLLVIFLPYVMIPILLLSLFFGFNYQIVGPDLERDEINNAISKAAKAAENMKEEFQEKYESKKEEKTEETPPEQEK